jgi:hypothetical protein
VARARRRNLAPLAIAGILAFPLFFASLLAVSLAIERPHVTQFRTAKGKLIELEHQPTTGMEAKIWALALVVPAIVVAVGALAMLWRRGGIYVVAAAGIVLVLALPHRLDRWSARHTARFPKGMDLIADASPSSTIGRGEWEQSAKETVLSLSHYTLGIALAVVLVTAMLSLRRRLGIRSAPVTGPPPAVSGQPEVSPIVGLDVEGGQSANSSRTGRS